MLLFERRNAGKRTLRRKTRPVPIKFAAMDVRPLNNQCEQARGKLAFVMGPDGYRTSLLFQHGMPDLRNDPRFARLCARLGLVEL